MLQLYFVNGEGCHIRIDVGEGPAPLSIAQHCESVQSPNSQHKLGGGVVVESGRPGSRIDVRTSRVNNILPRYVEVLASQCILKQNEDVEICAVDD